MPTPRDAIAGIAKTLGEAEPGMAVTEGLAKLGEKLYTLDRQFTPDTLRASLSKKWRSLTGKQSTPVRPVTPTRPVSRRTR